MSTKSTELAARYKRLLGSFHDSPDDLVFWSFRYFLGRNSIHTASFAADLARAWPHLDMRTAVMIRIELTEAFERDAVQRANPNRLSYPLGTDCVKAAWDLVRQAAEKASTPATHDQANGAGL